MAQPPVIVEARAVSRPDAPDAAALARWLRSGVSRVSAHRGGYTDTRPENALGTLAATNAAYPAVLLEVDVRRTRDGVLVLLHDETLERTTTGRGRLDERSAADVAALRLTTPTGVTAEAVPTLDSALAWSAGRAVLTLDVKPGLPPAEVVAAVRRHRAEGRAVVITYTPAEFAAFLALAPDLVYSVSTRTADELNATLAVPGVRPERLVAFVGTRTYDPEVVQRLRALGIPSMLGLFGADATPDAFERTYRSGISLIATEAVGAAFVASRPTAPTPVPADSLRIP